MPLWMLLSAVPAVAPPAAPPALPDVNTVCHVQFPPDLLAVPDPAGDDLVYFAHVYELRGVAWLYADRYRHAPPESIFTPDYLAKVRACGAAVRAHLAATPPYRGDATLRGAELAWMDGFQAALGPPADRVTAALDAVPPSAEDLAVVQTWSSGLVARLDPLDAAVARAELAFAESRRFVPPEPRPARFDCPTWPAPAWAADHPPGAANLEVYLALHHFKPFFDRANLQLGTWFEALGSTNPLTFPEQRQRALQGVAAERAWVAGVAPFPGFHPLEHYRAALDLVERALGPDADRWLELSLSAARTRKLDAELDALTQARTVAAPQALSKEFEEIKAEYDGIGVAAYEAWFTANPCPPAAAPAAGAPAP